MSSGGCAVGSAHASMHLFGPVVLIELDIPMVLAMLLLILLAVDMLINGLNLELHLIAMLLMLESISVTALVGGIGPPRHNGALRRVTTHCHIRIR